MKGVLWEMNSFRREGCVRDDGYSHTPCTHKNNHVHAIQQLDVNGCNVHVKWRQGWGIKKEKCMRELGLSTFFRVVVHRYFFDWFRQRLGIIFCIPPKRHTERDRERTLGHSWRKKEANMPRKWIERKGRRNEGPLIIACLCVVCYSLLFTFYSLPRCLLDLLQRLNTTKHWKKENENHRACFYICLSV